MSIVTPRAALAGPYTKLQVLLPGESPAPGTGTGKTGTPQRQTVGVPFNVTLRACDSSWNLVTTVTNSVTLTSTDGSAALPSSFALVNGARTVQVTLNATGAFTISATDNSDPTIPKATSASVSTMLLQGFTFSNIHQRVYDAGEPINLTIRAVNPSGQQVDYNGPVNIYETTSYGIGRASPDVITMSGGVWSGSIAVYRADVTNTHRGNVNIYAYLEDDASVNGTSDPFSVQAGSLRRMLIVLPGQDPVPGSLEGLTGSPAPQSAGQPFAVDVYTTDNYFNVVDHQDDVRITTSDPAANTVTGTTSNGYRRFSFTLATVGAQTLTVNNLRHSGIIPFTSQDVIVMANAAQRFSVDSISSPQTAGVSVNVRIRATDQSGNTTNFNGNALLIANTGPGSISPESIVFTNGVWQGPMTFKGAGGAVQFTVSDFSAPPHTGTSNAFAVNPGPVAKMFIYYPGMTPQGGTVTGYSGVPADQQAGATFNMTVRACDQYWNRVTGNSDTISLTSTDTFANMPAQITLSNGELLVPVKMFRSGLQRVTAHDATNSGVSDYTSTQIRIIGGPYSRIVALCPGESIAPGTAQGRTGTATDQSINYSFVVTVQATDQWFNPVSGPTDVIHLTSGDPLAQLPSDAAMVDGVAQMSVRLSTGGFQQITASNLTKPAMAASVTQVRMISTGFHLEAEVTPLNVQAGEQFTLSVKVTNDAGSVIQEINSSVTVTVKNATTQEKGRGTLYNTSFQLLQGQRAMPETYTFAEPVVLVVTDDAGNAPATTEVLTVTPGAATEIKLSSAPKWLGGNKSGTVSARLVDAFDNGVPDRPVTFSLLSGSGRLAPIDSLTSAAGVARCGFRAPRLPET
ncbi:MAG TPA: hypothetical protein VJS69_06090, partial [Candidatus Krumholzibacteria bacterium]|nr:hypothetical protein [Candidatus Krumholzibacteria bacterium]